MHNGTGISSTFQVGIVAKDGILLASDTRNFNCHAEKIVIVEDRDLAYCCAGGERAAALGAKIATTGDHCKTEDDQSEVFEECFRRVVESDPTGQPDGGSVLVALRTPAPQLWLLILPHPGQLACTYKIEEGPVVAPGGDAGNYAGFYLERFYPRRQARPVLAGISRLAAYTVLTAAQLNPAGVGGLEIVTCTSSRIERASQGQLDDLMLSFRNLENVIGRSLGLQKPWV